MSLWEKSKEPLEEEKKKKFESKFVNLISPDFNLPWVHINAFNDKFFSPIFVLQMKYWTTFAETFVLFLAPNCRNFGLTMVYLETRERQEGFFELFIF